MAMIIFCAVALPLICVCYEDGRNNIIFLIDMFREWRNKKIRNIMNYFGCRKKKKHPSTKLPIAGPSILFKKTMDTNNNREDPVLDRSQTQMSILSTKLNVPLSDPLDSSEPTEEIIIEVRTLKNSLVMDPL